MVVAALGYARQGRPVFPCHTPADGGCSCGLADCSSPGKHPRTRHGLRDASTDPRVIEGWWRRWPAANVGMLTGRLSGVVVVDVDPDHGGIDTMRRLVAEHAALPAGPRVHTGSGGWHVLFAWPGREVRNSTGRVGPGVDIRGDGGYVIAPPSLHVSGGRYVWTSGGELPRMPDWLARLVEPPPLERPASREPMPIGEALDRWAAAALRGELDRVRFATEGSRNHALNRAAFALGQIAGAGALDAEAVESHLRHVAMSAGLGDREATLTIRSGLAAGLARPRGPAERPTVGAAPVAVPELVDAEVEAELP
jgi:hypothetical protein